MYLTGKIAIVTGASSGLGLSMCKKLIEKGTIVYGLARNKTALEKLREWAGDRFHPVILDITNSDAVTNWVDMKFHAGNIPDILINNAGIGYFGKVEDISLEQWDRMLQTNLSGIFYLTRKAVPLMKQSQNSSHIINIASVAGLVGNPQISGYNATKFGLRGFSEALFKELRYDNIKVSVIFPGSVATPFFDKTDIQSHKNMLQPEDVADTVIHLLETPDNFLISEITVRPLNPNAPDS
ncbi:MAG: SDR family NAD(P)-dependent oxidoreductase [Balneolaceae bacterium]|nr:MAG: SDR family NAD(P)-dependent oxidoreductase [Balneolaceae bacterium]